MLESVLNFFGDMAFDPNLDTGDMHKVIVYNRVFYPLFLLAVVAIALMAMFTRNKFTQAVQHLFTYLVYHFQFLAVLSFMYLDYDSWLSRFLMVCRFSLFIVPFHNMPVTGLGWISDAREYFAAQLGTEKEIASAYIIYGILITVGVTFFTLLTTASIVFMIKKRRDSAVTFQSYFGRVLNQMLWLTKLVSIPLCIAAFYQYIYFSQDYVPLTVISCFITLWCLTVPPLAVLFLYQKRIILDNPEFSSRWGSLYSEFFRGRFFFFAVQFYRGALIALLATQPFSQHLATLCIMIAVECCYIFSMIGLHPFNFKPMLVMELLFGLYRIVMLICAIMYVPALNLGASQLSAVSIVVFTLTSVEFLLYIVGYILFKYAVFRMNERDDDLVVGERTASGKAGDI